MKLFPNPTRKKEQGESVSTTATESQAVTLKYERPKILLIDCPKGTTSALKRKGYNVTVGSFGKPYKVEKSSSYKPLIGLGVLSDISEQEIIVVDLAITDYADEPSGERHRPKEETDIWAKCDQGFIDPRPRNAVRVQNDFNRILDSGGVFVIFSAPKTAIELSLARVPHNGLEIQERFYFDEWHFLGELRDMGVKSDNGTDMHVIDEADSLKRLVKNYLPNSRFTCLVEGGYRRDNVWVSLVQNKFGQIVGVYRRTANKGLVIVLPQLAEKTAFLRDLLSTVLPEFSPHLFPESGGKWTSDPDYEIPAVSKILLEQAQLRHETEVKIATLDNLILEERGKDGWMHDLLTGTDTVLVEAIKKALGEIGFLNVADIDQEQDRLGKLRREDLQILDEQPVLIVDIKGISGFPSDEDVLQADKHATLRMRESKNTGFRGLSIINHQRHLPPLERDNTMPFRQELVDVATQHELGLLTSWDIYRLIRNRRKLAWPDRELKPLLYKHGRIEIVPGHYQLLGQISKAWTDKFGIVLSDGFLKKGDRIAVELAIEYEEIVVDSLQVNSQQIDEAKKGDPLGILWPVSLPKIREGMRVFRVAPNT